MKKHHLRFFFSIDLTHHFSFDFVSRDRSILYQREHFVYFLKRNLFIQES